MTDTATPEGGTPTPAPAAGTSPAAPVAEASTILNDAGGTPPATKEGEGKPGDVKASVPEKYDLKLPENTVFDTTALEGISAFARDLGLPQEAAQKLVERDSKMLDDFVQHIEAARKEAHTEQVKQWAAAVKADKELGGDKFADTTLQAGKAMKAFATPEFRKALDESGYGSHPELVRVFAKIGRTLSEDNFTPTGGESKPERDPATNMYPSMQKKTGT